MTEPADPASLLSPIRERINAAFTYDDWHRAARDDVPRLLAAVEAALKLHQPVTTNGGWLEGREWQECEACGPNNGCEHVIALPGQGESFWPCPTVAAITTALTGKTRPMQPGQVPSDHPDAGKPVAWGEHSRDCDCGDCP